MSPVMKEFIAPAWQKTFQKQALNFDRLWGLELPVVDTANIGRGRDGWSEVCMLVVGLLDGDEKRLILKRQKNHLTRTLLHPFRGIPTAEKELRNILHFKRLGIPTVEPVYFAKRRTWDGIQAILITEYLEGYRTLEEFVNTWQDEGWPKPSERNQIIRAIASLAGKIHRSGFQYNCLYPKHLLITRSKDAVSVRLIDLEKNKWRPLGDKRRIRDLETLLRRSQGWTQADRIRFLTAYFGIRRLDGRAKRLCRKVLTHHQKKLRTRDHPNSRNPTYH